MKSTYRLELPTKVATVIGTVIDENMWRHACVFVQQLVSVGTSLPIVIFNLTALPTGAVTLLHSLGSTVHSLDPPMPMPHEFGSPLLSRPLMTPSGSPVLKRYAPFAKLAVWGQTRWSKIVLLDVDVVLLHNIDEMGSFPADTFAPETCNNVKPERCAPGPSPKITTLGFNAGVMVIGPSARRFASMSAFATQHIGALLRAAKTRNEAADVENRYLAYPEQSFLKRYWPIVMKSTIEGGGRTRQGYDWQWRESREHGADCTPTSEEGCGTTNFMSRVYNARPFDCSTNCSKDYLDKVKVVHFTCSFKPWSAPRSIKPCEAAWTNRWIAAKAAVCERARTLGVEQEAGCVLYRNSSFG